jgi:serine-type D-Ala-D-Ala carboxypeptidase (penicillin-binding protein 5/6)
MFSGLLTPVIAVAQVGLAAATAPVVTAHSAIIMDAATGRVLWSKNADVPRYPASTTKIMTSLLLIERVRPDEIITAPSDVDRVRGTSLNLKPGEELTAHDMLYGLMLRSANDGSYATAMHISGSVPAFSKLMNDRAKEIGCTNTNFNNPHGLNDTKHTTTARDLALMTREAFKYPEFREVAKTPTYRISRSINLEDLLLQSKNKWLTKDFTANGVKTGFTTPAGQCYVGSVTRDNYQIITVVLKSKSWQVDHKAMLDWVYANHQRVLIQRPGDKVAEVSVSRSPINAIPAIVEDAAYIVRPKVAAGKVESRVELLEIEAPVMRGQTVGQLVLTDGAFEHRVPLVAGEDAPLAEPILAAGNMSFLLVAGGLISGAYLMRRRSRVMGLNAKSYR